MDIEKLRFAAHTFRLISYNNRFEIMKLLVYNDSLTPSEIARKLKLSHHQTLKELDLLTEYGILIKEKKGTINMYSANADIVDEIRDIADKLYSV